MIAKKEMEGPTSRSERRGEMRHGPFFMKEAHNLRKKLFEDREAHISAHRDAEPHCGVSGAVPARRLPAFGNKCRSRNTGQMRKKIENAFHHHAAQVGCWRRHISSAAKSRVSRIRN